MADKVTRVGVLLQTLSRIPGLSFLDSYATKMRETVDQIDEVGDGMDEIQRNAADARRAARDVVSSED